MFLNEFETNSSSSSVSFSHSSSGVTACKSFSSRGRWWPKSTNGESQLQWKKEHQLVYCLFLLPILSIIEKREQAA